jgi:hypothetical protein
VVFYANPFFLGRLPYKQDEFGGYDAGWMGDSQTTNFVSAAPVSWF